MSELPEIECEECMWQGFTSELLCHPEDVDKPVDASRFNMCPQCGSIGKFVDYEDQQESGECQS